MSFLLTSFNILDLHGDMDVKIKVRDNKLIIVAENGLGKTTIVNIIYYTLSQQWYKLSEYTFSKIEFTINGTNLVISRDELTEYIKYRRLKGRTVYRKNLSPRYSRVADYLVENNLLPHLLNSPTELELIAKKFEVPSGFIYDLSHEIYFSKDELFKEALLEVDTFLSKEISAQILYLPTYRRIEKDLKNIFPDLETNLDTLRNRRMTQTGENNKKYIELVEFGMDDVQIKVDQKLNSLYINFTNNLRQSLMGGYLKDILNKNYGQYNYASIQNISSEKLTEILSRIDNSILQTKEKDSLTRFVDNYKSNPTAINNEDKIIAYFIQKLVDIYQKQSVEEADVISFVNICNTYCINKDFIYSREERKIKVFLKDLNKEISFAKLSSGEKQIVSLFSHLYLSETKNFFVIIDEPELSLSVSWQERFLTDIQNAYNSGIIAVTHSPYIFSNELDLYTKGFNEFITVKS
ncbi:ATP-binding protein [Mucilaginibacter rubeus]|uniref:ATP-binding protein n=2 Tax=Pseudomonadati TaxID=3379134 RepID=A0AAE6JGY4_9SPHI|nr:MULTISPECIES: AAA family ATPase [Mucilaginibacter]QEM05489.1 ATP-binding protein [Mucilaginibacter rubeus]QEM18073.1 ATP-binding protein [Mucilaginibacter gossypii]QTE45390.1 ATP-binding protein [Mucilaginibacter rubeus]QTE51987.1 ATP-binding protein [Mucilaginibacter rubeus]QTE57076.1 ATP-binding protein [Mucilaginibacter rubeus]